MGGFPHNITPPLCNLKKADHKVAKALNLICSGLWYSYQILYDHTAYLLIKQCICFFPSLMIMKMSPYIASDVFPQVLLLCYSWACSPCWTLWSWHKSTVGAAHGKQMAALRLKCHFMILVVFILYIAFLSRLFSSKIMYNSNCLTSKGCRWIFFVIVVVVNEINTSFYLLPCQLVAVVSEGGIKKDLRFGQPLRKDCPFHKTWQVGKWLGKWLGGLPPWIHWYLMTLSYDISWSW